MEFKTLLDSVIEGQHLSFKDTQGLFNNIMDGKLSEAQIAGILVALRMKGETVDEIAAAASVMRAKSRKVPLSDDMRNKVVDTCGTGGDLKGTFNISTTVAFVLAAGGVPVAKHGNRSVSSKCGSADILEALGVKIDLPPEGVAKCIEETGFGFMFAPVFHPAMANVVKPRKDLGVRTIFNILGPLTNPAGAKKQLMGVFNGDLTEKLAKVLSVLGVERACVVHGFDGMDEITICDRTKITELSNGKIESYIVAPEDFGFKRADISDIKAFDTTGENKLLVEKILKGEDDSPKRDMVALNAGFGFYVAGVVHSPLEGVKKALDLLASGKPYEILKKVSQVSYFL
ncbi:anthranilate phosphoribosyltransferase [Desulfurobacterium atlanticum]|uniref:Anthranilate phosphoribosyltransferase n=1 Tax=Desulfurobacterium atlanticum TaxID=240169 RepID=A0A238YG50_9BACT|nr:anthranilate phosphoribosyltransferase [Desulfurobacterium atlanticum]SNR70165.1 anthranilate phosphoribosyltransferase [Desulfurobacterium atlanticum]